MPLRLGPALFLAAACGAVVLSGAPSRVAGQEKMEMKKPPAAKVDPAKQKAAAVATLKKADLTKASVYETDNFLIATAWPEEKAKALGAVLEKIVPVARKALQYEEKEQVWRGKLTVFVLPETREFKSFIRAVVQRDPQGVHTDVRADDPFVVDPVDTPLKATDADQYAAVAANVANAFLRARGSTAALPDWMLNGFGPVTAARAAGTNSAQYTKYRTAARLAAAGPKGGRPAALGELWGESKPANGDVLAASLAEYMAYGPGAPNFVKLVFAYRPNENGDSPATPQALEAAGWKDVGALEAAWRKWATAK